MNQQEKHQVLVDHHYPYDVHVFNTPLIHTEQVTYNQKLPRLLRPWHHILNIYFRSFRAQVILGNRRTCLLLALLYYVYKPRTLSLIGYEIIFNFKPTWRSRLVKAIWRVAIRHIDTLIVQTQSERSYLHRHLGIPLSKVTAIPFFAEGEEFIGPGPQEYIFAAGRMERDFTTLLKALENTPYQVVIVADQSQQEALQRFSNPNVRLYFNIHKEQYLKLLKGARLVVVPLYNGASSRGQVVLLEAMKYGKPIICSEVPGTVEYISQDQTGWLVPPGNVEKLRKCINLVMAETGRLQAIGKNAFDTQVKQFSIENFYARYLQVLQTSIKQRDAYAAAHVQEVP